MSSVSSGVYMPADVATLRREPTSAYSVAMLAKRWGTSDTFVYDQIARGNLRAFKLGSKLIRISFDAVEEYECRAILGDLARSNDDAQTGHSTGHGVSSGRVRAVDDAYRSARLTRRQHKP